MHNVYARVNPEHLSSWELFMNNLIPKHKKDQNLHNAILQHLILVLIFLSLDVHTNNAAELETVKVIFQRKCNPWSNTP